MWQVAPQRIHGLRITGAHHFPPVFKSADSALYRAPIHEAGCLLCAELRSKRRPAGEAYSFPQPVGEQHSACNHTIADPDVSSGHGLTG
jgi:hypothetical protein